MLGSTGGLPGSSGEGGSSSANEVSGVGEVMGTSSIMSEGISIGVGAGGAGGGGGSGDFYEGDRSTGGNRWPRQETLALLKIRSDMDGVFRDSSLKGPLWEEVSRKMAELGYHRSSKKCREKFENVYKYHKRTKDGRVGKSDGKTYKFFEQIEALEQHQSSVSPFPTPPPRGQRSGQPPEAAVPVTMVIPGSNVTTVTSTPHPAASVVHNTPGINLTTSTTQQIQVQPQVIPVQYSNPIQIGEGSSSPEATPSSSSLSGSDDEVSGRRRRKWKDFFERLTKEVIDKQEELHKRFIDAVERRERDRLIREEAWKAQEMSRLNREHEILVHERSMAAAKDAALMEFLKKVSDQQQIPISFPLEIQNKSQTQTQAQTQSDGAVPAVTITFTTASTLQPIQPQPPPLRPHVTYAPVPLPTPVKIQAQPQPQLQLQSEPQIALNVTQQQALVQADTNVNTQKTNNIGDSQSQASSSRWPKPEIEALISLRAKLDEKYLDSGPKGPLWEEISSSMKSLGYNRNAKRCKEKWENINKYYKKVKESNKRRPEDSKTCPYFHQLDALYRGKSPRMDINATNVVPQSTGPIMARPEQQWPGPDHGMEDVESDVDSEDEGDEDEDGEGSGGYEIVANSSNNTSTTAATKGTSD